MQERKVGEKDGREDVGWRGGRKKGEWQVNRHAYNRKLDNKS